MKRTLFLLISCFISLSLISQNQAETFIKEAQDLLAKKEYKQAQLSLQDAINEINLLIGAQIAESLPDEINGLKSDGEENMGSGGMGILGGGLQISKSYSNASMKENEAEVNIMANSPLLTSMNMYLSNPAMLGPEYKSVRVGTQRAILKTENDDYYDDKGVSKKIRVSELQIPLNSTLITINMKGFATEQYELSFANKLEIEKLKVVLND